MTKFKYAKYRPDEVKYYARMVVDGTAMTVFLVFNFDMELVGVTAYIQNLEWIFDINLPSCEFIKVILGYIDYLEKGN